MEIKYQLRLEWKPFSISLPLIEEWLRANMGSTYCGNVADDYGFRLLFTEEPSQEIKEAAIGKWNSIIAGSAEALAYLPDRKTP